MATDTHQNRAIVFVTWLYSLLIWLYVVARVTVNGIDPNYRFVNQIPYVSFAAVGAFSFLLSSLCLFIYLSKWGFRGRNTA